MSNTTEFISLSMDVFVWFEIIAACITYGFGFLGNLLSLFIFAQEEFRHSSTGLLFFFMTISNTIHLWTLTTEFLGTFNVYVYSNAFLQCRLNYFVQNVSRTVSTYVAVTVTLDRFIRSEFLMRSRMICTCQNAIRLTIAYLITSSLFYSFWFCPLNTVNPITGVCYTGQSTIFNDFFNNIFIPLRLVLVCVIPVIVMSIANARMLFNIRVSHRRVHQGNERNVNSIGSANRRRILLDRTLFCMMLSNVGVFIITQIPFNVYTLIQAQYELFDQITHLLIRAILLIWSSIYFGIGFYLYCLTSPLFREKFLLTFKKVTHNVVRPCSM